MRGFSVVANRRRRQWIGFNDRRLGTSASCTATGQPRPRRDFRRGSRSPQTSVSSVMQMETFSFPSGHVAHENKLELNDPDMPSVERRLVAVAGVQVVARRMPAPQRPDSVS